MAKGSRISAILVTVMAVLGGLASCAIFSSHPTPIRNVIEKFDAVVGVQIEFDVLVITTPSDETVEGGLHYRIFTVSVKMDGKVKAIPVCSRNPINPSGDFLLYSDTVGQWENLRWYNNGFTDTTSVDVTADQEIIYGDEVYDIPKPGRYLTVFGFDFGLGDLSDHLGQITQVPSFMRFSFQDKIGEKLGSISDAKIPFLAELPNYDTAYSKIERRYHVSFYLPLGGRLFGENSDGYDLTFYETTQRFKVGYEKDSWIDVSIPVWTTWLAAGAVSTLVPGVGTVAAFAYVASSMFKYDWDDDITLLRWDNDLTPVFVPLDSNPIASRRTGSETIYVER